MILEENQLASPEITYIKHARFSKFLSVNFDAAGIQIILRRMLRRLMNGKIFGRGLY
jgi:hypothetical protein